MQLGEKIYQLRTEKNLSQGELAEKLDISRQSVSKWENNTAVPDLDKLIKLCDVFEISLDEITGREKPKDKPLNKIEEIKSNLTKTQFVGCILFGVGLIFALLFPILSPSLIICGVICLTVRKKPWYWCIWVVFLPLLFIMGWATATGISRIIEILFFVVMAIVTVKAFEDTDIVIPKKKAIIILASSIIYDLLFIIYRLWTMGCFEFLKKDTYNGMYSVGTVFSTFGYGFMNVFLASGVGLSMIGIICSVKNIRDKNK